MSKILVLEPKEWKQYLISCWNLDKMIDTSLVSAHYLSYPSLA